jgi:hypothetical protein
MKRLGKSPSLKKDIAAVDEKAILSRVLDAGEATLSPEAAHSLLALKFKDEDRVRMKELSDKAREGKLTSAEQDEINSYEKAGHIVSLLKSKARLALRNQVNGS